MPDATAGPTVEEPQAPTPGTPPPSATVVPPPPRWEPDDQYKGLQRTLTKVQEENKKLKEWVDAIQQRQQGSNPVQTQAELVRSQYYNAAKERGLDEEAAAVYGNAAYQAVLYQASQAEAAALQNQLLAQEAKREQEAQARETTRTLRAMAADLGLSADDPSLDYGDEDESATARLAAFRRSVAQARQAQATAPVEPTPVPDRTAARADTSGGTSPPGSNAEILKQRALAADAAWRHGDSTHTPQQIVKMFDEARKAGADFST